MKHKYLKYLKKEQTEAKIYQNSEKRSCKRPLRIPIILI